MQLAVGGVAYQMFFEVLNEVDVNDIDGGNELRAGMSLVGLNQLLALVPIGMVSVVERTLAGVG